ncbi:MAG: [Clostridia bacterium]|nr:[FeFe] hydrogenase H-cluster radical SAM maturase HydE [Clostridia bacterium]
MINTVDKLLCNGILNKEELIALLECNDTQTNGYLRECAVKKRLEIYSNHVYIRGLIEISNICKNDCYYCGIRKSNKNCSRYRLKKEDILSCCKSGYNLGFRTFVLQGGEDGYYTDEVLCDIISSIKSEYPDCAVTLSLGERTKDSYKKLYDSGADRYLLRHETANADHYSKLHPAELTLRNRMDCLKNLKEIGFQTGCGFMVGSPYQTIENIAEDLLFIAEFKPQMVGVGPFIPHTDTPFKNEPAGDADLTCKILSIIRLMLPNVLLPATTALGSVEKDGREKGILYGANVVMPNLSPENVRDKYMLYNNKLSSGAEAAESLNLLKESMKKIGYETVVSRGDYKINN